MAKLLSILLQRNDTTVPWGFKLTGGREKALPVTILEVTPGTLAAQYLAAGDILLTIEGKKADTILLVELEDLIREPGKSLDLLVQKVSTSRSFPVTPSSPNYFTFPGTPTSPRDFYPGTPKTKKTPSYSSYPGTPKTPNTPSFTNSPNYPLSPGSMGIPKTQKTFSSPATPKTPNIFEEMGIPKTSGIQKTQSSVNVYRELISPKMSSRPDTPTSIDESLSPKTVSLQKTQSSINVFREQISPKTLSRPDTPSTPSTIDEVFYPKSFNLQKTHSSINVSRDQPSPDSSSTSESSTTLSTATDDTGNEPNVPATPSIWDYKMKPTRKVLPNGHNNSSSDVDATQWFSSVSNTVNGEVVIDEQNQYMTEIRKKVNDSRRAFLESAQMGLPDEEVDETSSLESFDSTQDPLRERRTLKLEGDRRSEGWYGLASYIDYRRPISLPASPLPPALAASDEEEVSDITRRQSSQISGGGTPSPGSGAPSGDGVTANSAPSFPAPPAPPPPPPPGSGHLPTVRLNTEIPDTRGQPREPPAAIQNAMMTKDKKPFTYTPGGLDLSQIRSPRMQRRITRNAAAEGVGEQPAAPKPSPLAQQPHAPLPPSAVAAMQPQLPVAVFPQGQIPQLHHVGVPPGYHQPPPPPPPPAPSSPPSQPSMTAPRAPAPPSPAKVEPPMPSPPVPQNEPGSIYVPPAPQKGQGSIYVPPTTPQNEPGSIYVPPVQTTRAQMGSLYIPPINNTPQQESPSPQRQTPQTPMSPIHPALNKAPTPWLTQRAQPQPQAPAWAREESQQPGTRIIPIQVHGMVEGRDPPQSPPQTSQSPQPTARVQSPQQSAQPSNTRIIPIQVEGRDPPPQQQYQQPQQQQQYQQQQRSAGSQSPRQLQQQQSWSGGAPNAAPIQSRSFRVLQKITDTDSGEDQPEQNQQYGNQWAPQQQTQGVPVHELRKLQLSDDDRALMDKFKAQVDVDSFLHNESDPRYRGASIPSRAFRMLQNMTDGAGADYPEQQQVPRGAGPQGGPQGRSPSSVQSSADSPPQAYIPPSEQQVQEPKKYTGGAIPSRSFRMLQAMTGSPENCGPGQSDM